MVAMKAGVAERLKWQLGVGMVGLPCRRLRSEPCTMA